MINYKWFIKEFKIISNIDLSLYKEIQMKRRIDNFIEKHLSSIDYYNFLLMLKNDSTLYEKFLEHLTINVTEFFRNLDSWDFLVKNIIPQIIKEKGQNSINIWSCGCSSGEEPYTLAIFMKELFPDTRIDILATDIDKKILSIAKKGFYNSSSLKNVPILYKHKYFKKIDDASTTKNLYSISEDIKSMVTFKNHNLLHDSFPNNIDLIICRNVVIYFKESAKIQLYKNFYNSLSKYGYLFVGNTEYIINYKDFNFSCTNCFFFKKN